MKRQGNYLAAALNNIETIKKAYNTAEFESEGSAEKELSNYQKSIQYSLDVLKASFQEFSTTAINSDFLKGIVNGGTEALNIATQLIDTFGILGTLLGGFGVTKGITSFVKGFDKSIRSFAAQDNFKNSPRYF